jgi:nucleoside-diphosphate-sugar epimerase
LHISDAVEAYKTLLTADRDAVHGHVFNILSGNYQVLAIAHEVRRALEERPGIALDLDIAPVGISRSYKVANQKFREVMGVELSRGIHDAVHEMWYDAANVSDLHHPIFCNISWFELLADIEGRLKRMGGSPF